MGVGTALCALDGWHEVLLSLLGSPALLNPPDLLARA